MSKIKKRNNEFSLDAQSILNAINFPVNNPSKTVLLEFVYLCEVASKVVAKMLASGEAKEKIIARLSSQANLKKLLLSEIEGRIDFFFKEAKK